MSSDIIEKEEAPYIPSYADCNVDESGEKTYHFTVGEPENHTIRVSKGEDRVIEEVSVIRNGKPVKSYRKETLNGLKEGVQERYDDNGNLVSHEEYKAGLEDGYFESYNSEGKLEKKGTYKNGKKEGVWEYSDGLFDREISYLNGKYNGSFKIYSNFDEKRQLSERRYYVNGNISGICESFYNGELEKKISYVDGKKDGVYAEYFDGEISVVGNYSKGKKTGEWTYYSNGKLVNKIENYKDGKKHGIYKECYYRQSKKYGLEIDHVIEINYINGLIDGEFPYEEYDKDGNLILKGSLIDKKKEGTWCHYQNNKLIAQDFYADDKLVTTIKSNIPLVENEVKEFKVTPSKNRKLKTWKYDDYVNKFEVIGETKDGLFQKFDCNDHLLEEGYYYNGKKVGIWKDYTEEGRLWQETPYDNGKIVGVIKGYVNGELYRRTYIPNVPDKEEIENCPYEVYLDGEISEQGKCDVDYKYDILSIKDKMRQRYLHGKPFDL